MVLKRHVAGVIMVAASVMASSACGGGATREEAVAELVSAGFTQDTAECVLTDLEAQGFEANDLTGSLSAEVEAAIDRAVGACISTADVGSLIASSEELREQFIDGILESGLIDRAQAECVVEALESDGVELAELFARGDFEAQMEAAVVGCL